MRLGRIVTMVVLLVALLILATACFLANSYPVATFTWVHESPFVVSFDASNSSDPDGIIVSYGWDFDDGTTATGKEVQHTFISPGDYDVCLTVTDEKGKRASITHTVHAVRELMVPSEFSSIQRAIDDAEDGDVIIVSPGTYQENIDFRGKAIIVRSEDPSNPTIVDATIITGRHSDRPIVTFSSSETRASVLEGFTIQGTLQFATLWGGGIYVNTASPTIRKNVIWNNGADFAGGGVYLRESCAHILGNHISGNQAQQGGGLEAAGRTYFPTIEGNTFIGNIAEAGGAIHLTSADPGKEPANALPTKLSNNTFDSNIATGMAGGAAVYVMYDCKLELDVPDSNTYLNNQPDDIFYEVPP
ncbi:PKD domain-containing protein [Candidatus Bipolaricaulota bacterium]|nr:PKD domain-containing protein [Candidatus Bipolaricaulota bacterium]